MSSAKEFAKGKNNCYESEDSFIIWKINSMNDFTPCYFETSTSEFICHVLVLEGEMKVRYGDTEYALSKNDYASFLDKTCIELISASADIKAYVNMVEEDFILSIFRFHPLFSPDFIVNHRIEPLHHLTGNYVRLFQQRLNLIASLAADEEHLFRKEMIANAFSLFLMEVANAYSHRKEQKSRRAAPESEPSLRKRLIFNKFVEMIPEYVDKERHAGFYASKLCITPQYLNKLTKLFSNHTVYQWLGHFLVLRICKCLNETDKSMQEIADIFNFPCLGTMCKFFKRETGITLTQYRQRERMKG